MLFQVTATRTHFTPDPVIPGSETHEQVPVFQLHAASKREAWSKVLQILNGPQYADDGRWASELSVEPV